MNQDIVKKAREYIGTKFLDKGRSKSTGIDCIGLWVCILHDLNITNDDFTSYGRKPRPKTAKIILEKYFDSIPLDKLEPGDMVYIRMHKLPQHFAVYTGETIIHAFEMVGKCVESRYSNEWKEKTVEAYRIRR